MCGWVGSTNLGDELVFAGVRRLFAAQDVNLRVVSVDPPATRRQHATTAIDHRGLADVARAARSADLVIFGGGGLVQDETSPFNLPYHLGRVLPALRAGTPVVGLGLGIGPLHTALGQRLARSLRRFDALTVRDAASLELLRQHGISAELGADTAWHLAADAPQTAAGGHLGAAGALDPRSQLEAQGWLNVCLRPWSGSRSGLLPVGWGRAAGQPDWFVPTLAAALDRTARRTGHRIRLVALQTDRDHDLHLQVAAAMTEPAEPVAPALDQLLATVGSAQTVVAMRYHAGIAATMSGRPSVLIGYSPKVDALAAELGPGARRLGFDRDELAGLDDAVIGLLADTDASAAVAAGRQRLVDRAAVNAAALERIMDAVERQAR